MHQSTRYLTPQHSPDPLLPTVLVEVLTVPRVEVVVVLPVVGVLEDELDMDVDEAVLFEEFEDVVGDGDSLGFEEGSTSREGVVDVVEGDLCAVRGVNLLQGSVS